MMYLMCRYCGKVAYRITEDYESGMVAKNQLVSIGDVPAPVLGDATCPSCQKRLTGVSLDGAFVAPSEEIVEGLPWATIYLTENGNGILETESFTTFKLSAEQAIGRLVFWAITNGLRPKTKES